MARYKRFYHDPDPVIMAMPWTRFLAYVGQIPAVRAEETLAAITATTFPHLESKRARKQVLRRLQNLASGITLVKKDKKTTGGIPRDVANLMALGMSSPKLRGLVQIIKKPKDDKQD